MAYAKTQHLRTEAAEVVDFDVILLAACTAEERAELLYEADLLVAAFAPERRPDDLLQMAAQLSAGQRDAEFGRRHARRVAAALKHLAQAA